MALVQLPSPGHEGHVTAYVDAQHPDVVVTEGEDLDAFPEILGLLIRNYVQVFSAGEDRVWIREIAAASGT